MLCVSMARNHNGPKTNRTHRAMCRAWLKPTGAGTNPDFHGSNIREHFSGREYLS